MVFGSLCAISAFLNPVNLIQFTKCYVHTLQADEYTET